MALLFMTEGDKTKNVINRVEIEVIDECKYYT